MVVMIGMTLLFAYVTVYAQAYKEGAGGAVLESLTIEDTCVMPSTSTIRVSVYNVATQENMGSDVIVKIAGIYVNGVALVNNNQESSTNPNYGTINFDEIKIEAGTHEQLFGDFQSLPTGYTYEVRVETVRGSTFLSTITVR